MRRALALATLLLAVTAGTCAVMGTASTSDSVTTIAADRIVDSGATAADFGGGPGGSSTGGPGGGAPPGGGSSGSAAVATPTSLRSHR